MRETLCAFVFLGEFEHSRRFHLPFRSATMPPETHMHKRLLGIAGLTLFFAFSGFGQTASVPPASVSVSREHVATLGKLKQQIRQYYACTCDCGCYEKEAEEQGVRAIEFLRQRVAKAAAGEKLAMVLDIDDTALSNYPLYRTNDFSYIPAEYDRWLAGATAPAIRPTLTLFGAARELGVAVFFISGRREDQRAATARNLRAVGYKGWTGMILRGPADKKKTASAYKTTARQKILARGYHLVLNVGDQLSDLSGEPTAEFSVKLPNPMYFLP